MLKPNSFPYNDCWSTSRLQLLSAPSSRVAGSELFVLIAAGAIAAAAVAFVPLPLRIPGHVIVKAALPIVVGLAVAPRRFGGAISGLSALATTGIFLAAGLSRLHAGAIISLVAFGPAIDLAMLGARRGGWPLYLRFAAAGLIANCFAFAVRWGIPSLATAPTRQHMIKEIGWGVFLSFAICGLVAGLISAAICFRTQPKTE